MTHGFREALETIGQEIKRLQVEAEDVYDRLVVPTFGHGGHHYPMTLYGYVMGAFARVDVCSRLGFGGKGVPQTKRMVDFLEKYVPADLQAHRLAVQLWRHTLMHTGRPRKLCDAVTGREYSFLLHWSGQELPRTQHYIIQNDEVLTLALYHLLDDLADAVLQLSSDAASDVNLQKRIESEWAQSEVQEFKLPAV